MNHWQKIEAIFLEASPLGGDERLRFLEEACAGDEALRSEVESLLDADQSSDETIRQMIGRAAQNVADDRESDPATHGTRPQRLGAYRLLEVLGQGGMSTVYRAVRADDAYAKEVAVKVVRSGMVTADTLSRFRQERQILADLEHPNIARLLDGGASDDGTPFVVMELVDGIPIHEYAQENHLPLRERLTLFRQVCQAVQAAHQSLVVHRDLKPGNILVQNDGTPKLLDFGIAKLLDEEAPALTVTAGGWMTPEYASPEQIRGERISTTSDVYSLGAVLYELLTDRRPYDLSSKNPAEIERIVASRQPTEPSKLLETLPEANASSARRPIQRRDLKGDLDNIILMALRKEPERRYGSAGDLDEDLERFQRGLPVRSRPDTFTYRSRKFVRRHRLAVALTIGLFTVLASFGWTMFVQSLQLEKERDAANLERDKARRVAGFLGELFTTPDRAGVVAGDLTARELVDLGAERLRDGELAEQAAVRAELLDAVGDVYLFYGERQRARELFTESKELRLASFGPRHLDVAASHAALANLEAETSFEEAEAHFRRALEIREELAGPRSPEVADTLVGLAGLSEERGDFEAALRQYREALEIYVELRGDNDERVIELKQPYAAMLSTFGRADEAIALFEEALAASIQLYGDDHLRVASLSLDLAVRLKSFGRYEEAEPHYLRALTIRRKHLGVHRETAVTVNNYGIFLRARGSEEEAGPVLREALDLYVQTYGPDHDLVAQSTGSYAEWLFENRSAEEAIPFFDRSVALFRASQLGADHWVTAHFRGRRGACLVELGRTDEAEAEMIAAANIMLAAHPRHDASRRAVAQLIEWFEESGQSDRAAALRERADRVIEERERTDANAVDSRG